MVTDLGSCRFRFGVPLRLDFGAGEWCACVVPHRPAPPSAVPRCRGVARPVEARWNRKAPAQHFRRFGLPRPRFGIYFFFLGGGEGGWGTCKDFAAVPGPKQAKATKSSTFPLLKAEGPATKSGRSVNADALSPVWGTVRPWGPRYWRSGGAKGHFWRGMSVGSRVENELVIPCGLLCGHVMRSRM